MEIQELICLAEKELRDIGNQINWLEKEVNSGDLTKAKEILARAKFEERKLNNFEEKFNIKEYL